MMPLTTPAPAQTWSGKLVGLVGDELRQGEAEVAAGEGALRTWMARGVAERTKSSTRRPSRATACARTPAKAGRRSSALISGT